MTQKTQKINGKVSIYKDFHDLQGKQITIANALERIRIGKSKEKVFKVRESENKSLADEIKKTLPAVCFSGTFNQRKDSHLLVHSSFLVLDFDNVKDIEVKKKNYAQ